jgi:hypothetical protein
MRLLLGDSYRVFGVLSTNGQIGELFGKSFSHGGLHVGEFTPPRTRLIKAAQQALSWEWRH